MGYNQDISMKAIGKDNLCGFASLVTLVNQSILNPELFFLGSMSPMVQYNQERYLNLLGEKILHRPMKPEELRAWLLDKSGKEIQETCAPVLKFVYSQIMARDRDTHQTTPFDQISGILAGEYLAIERGEGTTPLGDFRDFYTQTFYHLDIKSVISEHAYPAFVSYVMENSSSLAERQNKIVDGELFMRFVKENFSTIYTLLKSNYCAALGQENKYRAREIDVIYLCRQFGMNCEIYHNDLSVSNVTLPNSAVNPTFRIQANHWEREALPFEDLAAHNASFTGTTYPLKRLAHNVQDFTSLSPTITKYYGKTPTEMIHQYINPVTLGYLLLGDALGIIELSTALKLDVTKGKYQGWDGDWVNGLSANLSVKYCDGKNSLPVCVAEQDFVYSAETKWYQNFITSSKHMLLDNWKPKNTCRIHEDAILDIQNAIKKSLSANPSQYMHHLSNTFPAIGEAIQRVRSLYIKHAEDAVLGAFGFARVFTQSLLDALEHKEFDVAKMTFESFLTKQLLQVEAQLSEEVPRHVDNDAPILHQYETSKAKPMSAENKAFRLKHRIV